MRKYVLMRIDECGDCWRCEGDFLGQVFLYPAFDRKDDELYWAFKIWKMVIEEKAQKIWESEYGCENRLYLEEIIR